MFFFCVTPVLCDVCTHVFANKLLGISVVFFAVEEQGLRLVEFGFACSVCCYDVALNPESVAVRSCA